MISPHGGTLAIRTVTGPSRDQLLSREGSMPKLPLDAWALSELEMFAIGGYSPLEGFMTQRDYTSVVKHCRLANPASLPATGSAKGVTGGTPPTGGGGLVWTIPVTLAVSKDAAKSLKTSSDVALTHQGLTSKEKTVAVLHLEEAYQPDKAAEARQVFKTTEAAHPGVARLMASGEVYLGGKVSIINRPEHAMFQAYRLDPAQTRAAFEQRGWKRIVGFQTRNPIHRAHEYIQKVALEICDGLLLHPIVGETKGDDVSADVRMKSYEVLLQRYYPKDRAMLVVNPASMRYAGPREAIFHALIRKNYGCTHFVVGRDHAGVGKYYGTYDAQKIFEEFAPGDLGITPLFFENTFYCTVCAAMASTKTCPHGEAERVSLSGTKVRELLLAGTPPPPEVSRPEVAKVLIEAMRVLSVR